VATLSTASGDPVLSCVVELGLKAALCTEWLAESTEGEQSYRLSVCLSVSVCSCLCLTACGWCL